MKAIYDWTKPEDRRDAFMRLDDSVFTDMPDEALAQALRLGVKEVGALRRGAVAPDPFVLDAAVKFGRATLRAFYGEIAKAAPVLDQYTDEVSALMTGDYT